MSLPNPRVDEKQVKLAVRALVAHLEERSEQKSKRKDELFEKENAIWLTIGFIKIPVVKNKPKKILLPHAINKDKEVCLITKDDPKKVKETLEKQGVTSIKKVISLIKLRKNYKTYLLKRQLASSFDTFLCDDRIYHLVVSTLGKAFFKRKKEPIPVRLTYQNWNPEIRKCLQSTLLRMGHGPCSAIKVAIFGEQSLKEITENVLHAITVAASKIPGTWKNIQCLHIRASSSVALPIYQQSNREIAPTPQVVNAIQKLKLEEKESVKPTISNKDVDSKESEQTTRKRKVTKDGKVKKKGMKIKKTSIKKHKQSKEQ